MQGATLDFNFVIWLAYKDWIYTAAGKPKDWAGNTMSLFWKIICWSLFWLWIGEWPDRDWNGRYYTEDDGINWIRRGTKLANGFWAILWALRSDLEHNQNCLSLPAPGARCPCAFCGCQMYTGCLIPYTEFGTGAKWKAVKYTMYSFLLMFPNAHVIFRLPGIQ